VPVVRESTLNIEGITFPCTGHEKRQPIFRTLSSGSYSQGGAEKVSNYRRKSFTFKRIGGILFLQLNDKKPLKKEKKHG